MALDITGKLIQKLNKTEGISKAGKPWSKQEFIIETQETYPRKVMISVMNEKVTDLEKFNSGDIVTASLNIESREYNGRWYTDVRAWRLQGAGAAQGQNGYQGGTEAPPFEQSFSADSATDDLPF
ncbi:MAG: DUF3127 domain-containing protein [Bacteroidota bacterium]|jgi:hypothetical protein